MYRRRLRKNETGSYLLQLTSMVDMFTIILVFLLKSYSTSAYQVVPSDQVELPNSASQLDPRESLKVALSENSISVDNKMLIEWQKANGWKNHLHKKDKRFLPKLQSQLSENMQGKIALEKANDSLSRERSLVLQIDRKTSYDLIKAVLASAALAGFTDYQLLTLKE